MASQQMYFDLNTGAKIPAVGLGTWKSEPGKVGEAVLAALEAGYRHIDCAAIYGNEAEPAMRAPHNQSEALQVGEALHTAFSKGIVKREDIFVTPTNFDPKDAEEAIHKTLKDLQLDYLDLYLTHIPVQLKKNGSMQASDTLSWDKISTWRAMESFHQKGLARAIGVSNFSVKKLEHLYSLQCQVKPAVNQVELHPVWRNDKLVNFCKQHNVHVTAYSPLGSKDRPRNSENKEIVELLDHDTVKEVAEKVGKSPGQVVLRWGVQRGTSVLPKSTHPERIKQNLDLFNFELSQEDMQKLSSIEPQARILDFAGMWVGDGKPVPSMEEMWDGEM
eukprot:SM000184S03753  [mRNA]  locus=s184:78735:81199:+ [translate_table: standard]